MSGVVPALAASTCVNVNLSCSFSSSFEQPANTKMMIAIAAGIFILIFFII
jgi:hypothetical protein